MGTLKERIISKRTVYTLCFLTLMVIDWTRGSQVGSTWAWTVNMTGVVIAIMLMCKQGFQNYRKPIYGIYSLFCIVMLFAMYFWWNTHQAAIYRDKLLSIGANIWFLGLIAIYYIKSVKSKSHQAHFRIEREQIIRILRNHILEIMGAVLLVLIWISVNEDLWPTWYLVLFGLVYIDRYTDTELEDLREGLLNGIILGFFVLQGLALLFRHFDDPMGRYSGMYANYNMNALFYCIVWIAFKIKYYDAVEQGEKRLWCSFYYIFTSILVGFLLFTICRTSWLVVLTIEFASVILLYFVKMRDSAGRVMGKIVLRLLTILICIPVIYVGIRYIPTVLHHPVWYEGEYSEDKVHSFDPWNSEKYVSFEEWVHEIDVRIRPYAQLLFPKAENVSVVCAQEEKLNFHSPEFSSSRGRLMIWEYYLKNGTIVGHSSSEGHEIFESWYVWHTQNVFVQFWYYYGIPAAIVLIVYILFVLISSLNKFMHGNRNALLTFFFVLLFICYGMFEAVWYPGQIILFLTFFTPLFIRDKMER